MPRNRDGGGSRGAGGRRHKICAILRVSVPILHGSRGALWNGLRADRDEKEGSSFFPDIEDALCVANPLELRKNQVIQGISARGCRCNSKGDSHPILRRSSCRSVTARQMHCGRQAGFWLPTVLTRKT